MAIDGDDAQPSCRWWPSTATPRRLRRAGWPSLRLPYIASSRLPG